MRIRVFVSRSQARLFPNRSLEEVLRLAVRRAIMVIWYEVPKVNVDLDSNRIYIGAVKFNLPEEAVLNLRQLRKTDKHGTFHFDLDLPGRLVRKMDRQDRRFPLCLN